MIRRSVSLVLTAVSAVLLLRLSRVWLPALHAQDSDRAADAAKRLRPALTRDLEGAGLRFGDPVFLRIFKDPGELELWVFQPAAGIYKRFRTYKIAKFSGTLGPKLREGDRQAPEGFYSVAADRMNPRSAFHLSFDLGYPNAYDRHHDRTGSLLMVHGSDVSTGCYAMTDAFIEEIYTLCDAALKNGQDAFPAHCFPFRLTEERLLRERDSGWFEFWTNLKEGYDAFERSGVPPDWRVEGGRYQFPKPEPAP
ncbi:MAG TPA: murein L,D-transpeptidase family protein [Verrucomicrobiales bacterium]|nr:murein L,D-transpeptidase family protein [Verrucomicrobiales bacterium]